MSFRGEQQDLFAVHAPRLAAAFVPGEDFRASGFQSAPLQVHLVAPPIAAWGLTRLMQTAGAHLSLIGSSCSLHEAAPLLERDPADVVVVDLDDGYGIDDLRDFYDRTRARILVLTSMFEEAFLHRILNAGARGVLQKRDAPVAVLRAIEAIGEGSVFASQPVTDRLFVAGARSAVQGAPLPSPQGRDADTERIASLTLRERQTIAALVADASAPVKVIADRLCISEHTLRNHLSSIYGKLGLSSRLDLYAYATRHKLCAPE